MSQYEASTLFIRNFLSPTVGIILGCCLHEFLLLVVETCYGCHTYLMRAARQCISPFREIPEIYLLHCMEEISKENVLACFSQVMLSSALLP